MSILSMVPALVGAATSVYGAIRSNKAAKEQTKRQKELQEHSQKMQKKTWQETNLPAQVAMAKEAGLNPALFYGGSAAGSATTGSTTAGTAAQENVYDIGESVNRALTAAQIEATKAQAEKTKAETEKISGIDTTKAEAEQTLTEAKTEFQKLENELKGRSLTYQVEIYAEQANKMAYEAVQASVDSQVSAETAEDRVRTIAQEAIGAMLGNQLTREKINEVIASIEQRYEQNRLQGQSIEQSKENTERIAEAMLWGAGIHAAGSIVNNVIDVATMPKTITKETTKEVINRGKKWQTKDVTKTRE